MELFIEGTLPVAISVLDGQTTLKLNKIILYSLSALDGLQAQANLKADQFVVLGKYAASIKLVDENNAQHPLTYEALAATSDQNLVYLSELRETLNVKERAET